MEATNSRLCDSRLEHRQLKRENEAELQEIKQEISEKQNEKRELDYAISYKRENLKNIRMKYPSGSS